MKVLTCATFVCLAFGSQAVAQQTRDADVIGPIHKFIDSFDKGDGAAAAATYASTDDLVIIDEVPPFVWHGTNAFQAWSSAVGAESKKAGITSAKVTLGGPARVERDGDQAYVVVPATYSFTQGGKAMREPAHMSFVLKKDAGGAWLIHAWAWAGPKAPAATTSK
jgi:ketosteroid isomerase-like protein